MRLAQLQIEVLHGAVLLPQARLERVIEPEIQHTFHHAQPVAQCVRSIENNGRSVMGMQASRGASGTQATSHSEVGRVCRVYG